MALEKLFDWLFQPFLIWGPGWGVIIISLLLTIMINIFYKLFTDQELMKNLKKELKDLQKEMKTLKDNPEKFMSKQKEAMTKNLEYMKHSMKPTLITFVPLILIFGWLKTSFADAGDIVSWGFSIPLFGEGLGWLGTYFFSAIIFSIIIRKVLKIS
ncbi:MAG: EMC3/TMCO1 family protein [Nanoarchaeota archaeon]|nr:EMC3/TMCO1 family protein [Nanoarchaeota archaeon]